MNISRLSISSVSAPFSNLRISVSSLTLIRNFYKFLMDRIDAKAFGLKISEPFCIH